MTMTSELDLSSIFLDARTNSATGNSAALQPAGTYVTVGLAQSGQSRSATVGTYVSPANGAASIADLARGQYVGGTIRSTDGAGSYVTL